MSADSRHKSKKARALPAKEDDEKAQPQPKSSGLVKAEKLAGEIDKALTGTLHGEFFEGTKSSNATRHKQLPEIFALRAEIQELKTSLENKDRHGNDNTREEQSEARVPTTKLNANWTAAITNLISEQLTGQLRDLKIREERREARLQKGETENKTLTDKIHALETKARKSTASQKPQGFTAAQYQALTKKVTTLETQLQAFQTNITELQGRLRTSQRENQELRGQVLQEEVNRIRADKTANVRLSNAEEKLGQHAGKFEGLLAMDHELSLGIRTQSKSIDELQTRLDELEAEFYTESDDEESQRGDEEEDDYSDSSMSQGAPYVSDW
ncbi:Hypothetical predicted protein [Lecanosticta acicola]|uniref:Uncharacterized protein n=1 Tax=Lecanosticta acicola TaxID=111012 RepID=A0AAI9EBZ8_9PEZI|nr:Hypothetical predicted protein [Lecanosticta acicola]